MKRGLEMSGKTIRAGLGKVEIKTRVTLFLL